MSKPSAAAYERVKRLARYLSGLEEVLFKYEWQTEEEALNLEGESNKCSRRYLSIIKRHAQDEVALGPSLKS